MNFLRKPEPVKKPRLSAFAFGPWSDWLYCSENCGIGETSRTRECTPNGNDTCPADGTCLNDSCVYESKQCQIQKCLTCANFPNYCDNESNTECKDVTLANGEVTVCCMYCFFIVLLRGHRTSISGLGRRRTPDGGDRIRLASPGSDKR